MWLSCEPNNVIAERVGWSDAKVSQFFTERQLAVSEKPGTPEYTRANHAEDAFQKPIYNIWKQQEMCL